MDEQNLLSRLRHGDEQALAAAITQYSAYVVTVIHNRSRGLLSPEDEDELASSVFFTLWQSCRTVKSGHLRAWLGSVARNKTVDRLRKSRSEIPLDEDLAGTDDFLLEEATKREQAQQQEVQRVAELPRFLAVVLGEQKPEHQRGKVYENKLEDHARAFTRADTG